VALFTEHSRPIERITIRSEVSWAAAYVRYRHDDSRRLGETYRQMFADLCTLMGGIEAERLLMDDVSTGAAGSDLVRATELAHFLVEFCGMGSKAEKISLRQFRDPQKGERFPNLSQEQLAEVDRQVSALIDEARENAAKVLGENKKVLEVLRDLVLEQKTIDAKTLAATLATLPGGKKAAEKLEEKQTEDAEGEVPGDKPAKSRPKAKAEA
jgi:cell division protease FtsH